MQAEPEPTVRGNLNDFRHVGKADTAFYANCHFPGVARAIRQADGSRSSISVVGNIYSAAAYAFASYCCRSDQKFGVAVAPYLIKLQSAEVCVMIRPVFALFLMLVSPVIAHSAPITFSFSGSVVQVPADDPGGGIGFGTPIIGTYTFDGGVADAIADPSQAAYMAAGAGFGLSVQIASNAYDLLDLISINVGNDVLGIDQYGVFAFGDSVFVSMLFEDFSASTFGNDGLPLLPPALASFARRDFKLVDTAFGDVQIDGVIDTLVCTAGCPAISVPVPGTLALLGTGLLLAWRPPRRSVCVA